MPTIRPPALTEYDLGPKGWRLLFDLARARRRTPKDQYHQLALYGLERALSGEDTELSQERLDALLRDCAGSVA